MRKFKTTVGYVMMAVMLAIGGVSSFAATQHSVQQIAAKSSLVTGQITQINEHSLSVKDQNGNMHMINFKQSSMVQGLKDGDRVTVATNNGQATSIRKLGTTSSY